MRTDQKSASTPSRLTFFLALCLLSWNQIQADIRLPAVIGDNMVLQRGRKAPMWGWAQPGEKIAVTGDWQSLGWHTTADNDGKWMILIDPPRQTDGRYTMTFRGNNTIEIKNILVGEVWVCSGQSNMEWPVRSSVNAEKEIAAADYPTIRLFTVQHKVAEAPQSDCEGNWQSCSPETIGGFSAVGYFFGRELHRELDLPIGLIQTSWGGTPAEAWTSKEALQAKPECEPILQRYAEAVQRYPQAKKEYEQQLRDWEEAVDKAKAKGQNRPRRPHLPFGPEHPHAPAGLYNGMIAPLIPYAIRGAIWYQGESNAGRAYQYRTVFPTMIQDWRIKWRQGDFPFLFVQLANFRDVKPEPVDSDWAELREAQLMTLSLPNTGMAVIIDIGEAHDIHPKNKQDVGKRLALWALAKTHGKDVTYSGPLLKSTEIRADRVILHFDHVDGGLVADGGGPLKGFAIAAADRKFIWADAKIAGEAVVVSSEQISKPVAVRYAWADNPVCNLYNEDGLPASPFRTDDWPGITVGRK